MILQNREILVFAASGAISGEVARTFAREGARVWLSARHADTMHALAAQIEASGGTAMTDIVDATDPAAVDAYVARVAEKAGHIDAVFNGIGGRPVELGYPEPTATTSFEHFMIPLQVVVGSQFLTARAAGAQMVKQGSGGAIVILSASLSVMTAPFMAGISAANGAVEALTRSLAGEFGRAGIRVNCVRGSGMPETRTIQETVSGLGAYGITPSMSVPPLGRPISLADTAGAAAFLASDLASGMTGQVVTVCGGVFVG